MDKVTAIKIKYADNTYSEKIPFTVLSENVEWNENKSLVDILGTVDLDKNIQNQIDQLYNNKISLTQLNNYVNNQLNNKVTSWLDQNVNPVGSAVIIDKSLSIDGAAADAKKTGDELTNLKEDLNNVENQLFTYTELSERSQSKIRVSGGAAYANIWYEQNFVEGHTYKIVLTFDPADISSFYCGTSNSNTTNGSFVDGGNFANTQWKVLSAEPLTSGYEHTIWFTATGNAAYFRLRIIFNSYDYTNTIKCTVYERGEIIPEIEAKLNPIASAFPTVANNVQGMKGTLDSAIQTGIARCVALNQSKKYFNICFLTDTHADVWDASGAFNAVNVIDKAAIADAFIHSGDFIASAFTQISDYIASVENVRISDYVNDKIIVAKGNHDNTGGFLTNPEFVQLYQNKQYTVVNEQDPDGGYFYVDFAKTKTRIIILNVWGDSTLGTSTPYIDPKQLTWLYNVALHPQDGYTLLVFAHNVSDSDSTIDTSVFVPLRNLLHAYVQKGTQYGDYIFNTDDPGVLAGVIVGHRHQDSYSNSNGFNRIAVTRAGSVDNDGYAVDIFTIDTINNILYETRIGRGDSRAYNFGGTNSQIVT